MPVKQFAVAAIAASQPQFFQAAPVATRETAFLAPVSPQQGYAVEVVQYQPLVQAAPKQKTADLLTWLALGAGVGAVSALGIAGAVKGVFSRITGGKKQNFLEADPYWDQSSIPNNTFKPKEPFTGKIISCKRIVGPQATGETCHIIMNHEGKMPYWEGQSYGVVPPGVNPKNGKPNSVRLYSIASSRYGDDMKGTTTSLCVRRATYWCPEMNAEDPAKKGVCSNFLCDSKPGDELKLTGPTGKAMLLPEKDASTDIIMVATGTGIAPYRSFLRRLFVEKTPFGEAYKGLAWLFLGVANTDALLYDDEWQDIKKSYPDNFRLDYALSREQTNADGGKMYIQDKVKEYADEIFDRMDKGAHIYFCGLKGMMPGITEMLEGVSKNKGVEWADVQKKWKSNGQWHVEVY
jgi:ferredoxin--NADP+ reductase